MGKVCYSGVRIQSCCYFCRVQTSKTVTLNVFVSEIRV